MWNHKKKNPPKFIDTELGSCQRWGVECEIGEGGQKVRNSSYDMHKS